MHKKNSENLKVLENLKADLESSKFKIPKAKKIASAIVEFLSSETMTVEEIVDTYECISSKDSFYRFLKAYKNGGVEKLEDKYLTTVGKRNGKDDMYFAEKLNNEVKKLKNLSKEQENYLKALYEYLKSNGSKGQIAKMFQIKVGTLAKMYSNYIKDDESSIIKKLRGHKVFKDLEFSDTDGSELNKMRNLSKPSPVSNSDPVNNSAGDSSLEGDIFTAASILKSIVPTESKRKPERQEPKGASSKKTKYKR